MGGFTIDKEFEVPIYSPVCTFCKHLDRDALLELSGPLNVRLVRRCAAFRDEIPLRIWTGEHDHRRRFRGDHGIMFEWLDPLDHKVLIRLSENRVAVASAQVDLMETEKRLHQWAMELLSTLKDKNTRDDSTAWKGLLGRFDEVTRELSRVAKDLDKVTSVEPPYAEWQKALNLEAKMLARVATNRASGGMGGNPNPSQKRPIQEAFLARRVERPLEGLGVARSDIAKLFGVDPSTVKRYTSPGQLRRDGLIH